MNKELKELELAYELGDWKYYNEHKHDDVIETVGQDSAEKERERLNNRNIMVRLHSSANEIEEK